MKTDGNPFFVFEVLRGLKDGQYLTQKADGTWATTRVMEEIQIPASIADMIQARVGDLTEDERSLLEIAACAGFGKDAGTVVALKVVHPHLLETPGFFRRFLREAEVSASIRHDNVVGTLGADAVAVGGAQKVRVRPLRRHRRGSPAACV